MLNDCFLSLVSKDCARDEVLVRARRKGDIEKLWPRAKVARGDSSDYLYRARIAREDVKRALAGEVDRIVYPNFKDSVKDADLHRAYARVWADMLSIEDWRPRPSYASFFAGDMFAGDLPPPPMPPKRRRRKRKRLLRRGQ